MNDVTIFTLGSVVFVVYMFFLGRMIWNQHKKQNEDRPNMSVVRDNNEMNKERRKAS